MIPSSSTMLALAASLALANATPAMKFEFQRRSKGGMKFSADVPSLPTFSVGSAGSGGVANMNDLLYTVDCKICDQIITLQLDTGSTDLWAKPPKSLTGAQTTNLQTKLTYGVGDITGKVTICPVTIGEYAIAKQAFLLETSSHFDNLYAQKTYGILGLGFDSLSGINDVVTKSDKSATWGRSLLTNLFYANPKTPNYIAFLLDRASDLDTISQGSFTVGESEPAYSSVIKQPALAVWPDKDYRRWTITLDSVNVGGKPVTQTASSVKGAPSGKTIALLDTGASLALGPKAAIDAIYSSIPGSYYLKSEKVWVIPCTSSVLVEFVFGAVKVPIHPLDLAIVTSLDDPQLKGTVCVAAFREFDLKAGAGELDWLLGDAFLRNVYSMYDFGDLDTSTGGLVGHPFIKLLPLPTSEYKAASAEFQTARKATLAKLPAQIPPTKLASFDSVSGGSETSSNAGGSGDTSNPQALAADGSGASPTVLNDLHEYMDKLVKYMPYILGLLGGMTLLLLILLIISIVLCARRGKGRTYQPITH